MQPEQADLVEAIARGRGSAVPGNNPLDELGFPNLGDIDSIDQVPASRS